MCGYYLVDIIRQIHKGTHIDIQSFQRLLYSLERLEKLKRNRIGTCSVWQLIKGLFSLNKKKMSLSILFFILRLLTTISMPFFLSYIIQNLASQNQPSSLVPFIIIIIMYKLTSNLIWTICDFLYTDLGIEIFAALYCLLLGRKHLNGSDAGKAVNIIEYDCNLVSSIAYSSMTTFFYCIELMILFGILISYLANTQPYSVFALIVFFYVIAQGLASYGTFRLNKNYINQKDKRLSTNLNQDDSTMLKQRGKQLKANAKFLFMRMTSKAVTLLFPLLLNIYVFLLANRSQISQNEYIILIVINLIRNPIGELMLAMNLSAEILNSCRRIVEILNKEKDQEKLEITEELIVNQEKKDFSGQSCSCERGNINLKLLTKSLLAAIDFKYWICLIGMFLLLLFSRYYANLVTKMMLSQELSLSFYIGLSAEIICPLLFYTLLIASLQKIAQSIFTKLPSQLNYQGLNRISGDISAVDRSTTINIFEISFYFTIILGSYIYSIISIGDILIEVLLSAFLILCIWMGFSLNRFVMKARRQLFRSQLAQKSIILGCFLQQQEIQTSITLKKHCISIFQCKQMGIFTQSYYSLLINLITLLISTIIIVISTYYIQNPQIKSILIMICLTLDRDILLLFYSMVRLELSLISFERVLNIITL